MESVARKCSRSDMAERINPFSMNYELKTDTMQIVATMRRKNEAGDFEAVDSTTLDYSGVAESVRDAVNLYGLSKLVQDRSSEVKAGPEKLAALREVFDQLVAGQWEKARVVGTPIVSAEIEALAQLKGVDIPTIQKALKQYDKEQKERILANPAVVARAAEIEAERAASTGPAIGLDDLLAA